MSQAYLCTCHLDATKVCVKCSTEKKRFFLPLKPSGKFYPNPFGGQVQEESTTTRGNCYFDAIQKSKHIPVEYEGDCRSLLFSMIRGNIELYFSVYKLVTLAECTRCTFMNYIESMELNGVWANTFVIFATSIALMLM
jgi:hypothetical protein